MTGLPSLRMLPVHAWPEIDRQLWKAAKDDMYVATLNPAALSAIAEGYGRWLAVLTGLGRLDGAQRPASRVTLATVQDFIVGLRAAGNKNSTVVARLCHLGSALRILEPEHSFLWLHPRKILRLGQPGKVRKSAVDQRQDWPLLDRQLWQAGIEAGDILDEPNYAARVRPATLHSVLVGYRSWLVFLRAEGRLDLTATPAARVTRAHVGAYFRHLRATQTNASTIARLSELRSAMLVMHPHADFRWVTSPGGRSLSALLPITPQPIQNIDSKVLYGWGLAMMEKAQATPNPEHRRLMYRNGLLIALFAARAPRVRSMASLLLGTTIILAGATYRMIFKHEDIKTGRRLEYMTPAGLSTAINHYITVTRAELSTEQSSDWFWLNQYGEKMGADEIADMIQRKSKLTFEKGFGPHRFRHALGTTAPLSDPAHPGVAAAILGVTGRMVEQHYNRASQADVADAFQRSLAKVRAERASVARREFKTRQQLELL